MLRPSDSHLWVKCPLAGELLNSGAYYATHDPEKSSADTDSRREGTCAHWAADEVFNGTVETAAELIGEAHANGWVVDEEMAGHVQDYVDFVRSFGAPVASEMPVQLFDLINGRLDTVSIGNEHVVRIFDFKYGFKPVEVRENYAMLCYGLAAVKDAAHTTIELHVYQPRASHPDGPHRVWTIPPQDYAHWYFWLEQRAQACFHSPQGVPGSQCEHCPARGSCHALTANVGAQYELIRDNRMTNQSPAELGAFLTFLELASDLVNAKLYGIRAETMARLNRGTIVPGWGTDIRKGNRKFTVDRERVRLATGIDPVKTVPMSPAELERAGAPKHVVAIITQRPTIGKKLTNDPEAIARRLFGNV